MERTHLESEPIAAKIVGRTADLARVHRPIRVVASPMSSTSPPRITGRDCSATCQLALTVRRGRPPLVLHLHWQRVRAGCGQARPGNPLHASCRGCSCGAQPQSCFCRPKSCGVAPHVSQSRLQRRGQPFRSTADRPSATNGPLRARGLRPCSLFRTSSPRKGCSTSWTHSPSCAERIPCRLIMAGTGPAREDLALRVAALDLGDAVELCGYVSGRRLEEVYPSRRPLRAADVLRRGLSAVDHGSHGPWASRRDDTNTRLRRPAHPRGARAVCPCPATRRHWRGPSKHFSPTMRSACVCPKLTSPASPSSRPNRSSRGTPRSCAA